jgi:condensin complex subunit 1
MYEIALCTIDPEPQISSLAKLFFQELAQRNNGLVIYNAMPDMISNLSGGGGGAEASADNQLGARSINEESFRTIVTYLFTFIKRDKQCETLIEKLCQGFRQASSSERKCRDLAFCLSKIQLSENGIKKLKETFKFYADKLTIPMVYDTFKQVILKNARKLPTLKNETRLLIDELEKQIDEVKQKGIAEEPAAAAADEQDEEMSENDAESNTDDLPTSGQTQKPLPRAKINHEKLAAAVSQPQNTRSSRSVPVAAVAVTKKGGKPAPVTAAKGKAKEVAVPVKGKRRVVIESSSDEDDDEKDEEEEEDDDSDSD